MDSTRTRPAPPAARWLAAALVALAGLPAGAGQTTFDPALELQQAYQENVAFVVDPVASDELTVMSLVLPVRRQWERGTLSFLYRPTLVRYSEFEVFDRDDHLVTFGMNSRPSPLSRFDLRGRAEHTQTQGDPRSTDDSDLFLAPRENRDRGIADLRYGHNLSRSWTWQLALGATAYRYTPIVEGAPASADRTEYRGAVEVTRALSASQRLGLQYSARAFDFEFDPDVTSDSVRGVWATDLDRDYGFELGAGAYRMSGEIDGVTEERTGFDGFFRLRRKLRRGALGLELRNEPSSGGNLKGTSVNSVVAFSWTGQSPRNWAWSVAPRLAYRDPIAESTAVVSSAGLDVSVTRRLVDQVGLRLDTRYLFQTQDYPGSDADDEIESFGVAFGVVWNPLVGTRLAGR